jgi:serine/threonine-protein phosphatase 2B regulatory subunit
MKSMSTDSTHSEAHGRLTTIRRSGGGTVDFQEFVGGLSAFSSRGGREEKLRCQ